MTFILLYSSNNTLSGKISPCIIPLGRVEKSKSFISLAKFYNRN